MPAEAKTEQQLTQELSALLHEVGTRSYARTRLDAELAELHVKIRELDVELFARRQARAAVEAEKAAEAAAQAAAVLDAAPAEVAS